MDSRVKTDVSGISVSLLMIMTTTMSDDDDDAEDRDDSVACENSVCSLTVPKIACLKLLNTLLVVFITL
jgi:hypothetical protein